MNNGSVGLSAKFSSSRDLAKKIIEHDNDKISEVESSIVSPTKYDVELDNKLKI